MQNGSISKIQLFAYSVAYRRGNRVISQTDEMGVEACSVSGLNSSMLTTLRNPVDEATIDKNIGDWRSPFSVNHINFMAAGRLHHEKGFDVLMSTFAQVSISKPENLLHIIGADVGEGERLKQLIEKYGLEGRVKLHGFISNPYVYFKYCGLYILSSRWESMTNTVLECCYIGCRILCTRCVPVLESISPSESLVDVDSIEQITKSMENYTKVSFGKYASRGDWNEFFDLVLNYEGAL